MPLYAVALAYTHNPDRDEKPWTPEEIERGSRVRIEVIRAYGPVDALRGHQFFVERIGDPRVNIPRDIIARMGESPVELTRMLKYLHDLGFAWDYRPVESAAQTHTANDPVQTSGGRTGRSGIDSGGAVITTNVPAGPEGIDPLERRPAGSSEIPGGHLPINPSLHQPLNIPMVSSPASRLPRSFLPVKPKSPLPEIVGEPSTRTSSAGISESPSGTNSSEKPANETPPPADPTATE